MKIPELKDRQYYIDDKGDEKIVYCGISFDSLSIENERLFLDHKELKQAKQLFYSYISEFSDDYEKIVWNEYKKNTKIDQIEYNTDNVIMFFINRNPICKIIQPENKLDSECIFVAHLIKKK